MAPKLDGLISLKDQSAWRESPRRDGTEGLRPFPHLADDQYDNRLRRLLRLPEWPQFQRFLRFYLENGILQPLDTQPATGRVGWWRIYFDEDRPKRSGFEDSWVRATIYTQCVFCIDFRRDPQGDVRAWGEFWLDKTTMDDALLSGVTLASTVEVGAKTGLKDLGLPLTKLALHGVGEDDFAELCDSDWLLRAVRGRTLHLMRRGMLAGKQLHIPKLVDAVFAQVASPKSSLQDPAELELETEKEILSWRRVNGRRFSEPVLQRAGGRCQISDVATPELIQACHIKPFAQASDAERIDPDNGLSLAVHIHAAFDAHLIGIEPDGAVVYSEVLTVEERTRMNLPTSCQVNVRPRQRKYLTERFEQFLRKQRNA
ncbi:MAG TPA: HNH endonuclease signature motif containing protein [Roseiarcus sp.]|nr:HNH endonuclease signature motif containing protein [Roseiarcus sp.]